MSSFKNLKAFVLLVTHNFLKDDCFYRASALAFTSLLAIVPLMYVGLSALTFFEPFQALAEPLQNFIFKNFVPATGKVVQDYLQQFTAQAGKLPFWDLLFLLVTSVFMMITIEYAMNTIWRTPNARHNLKAISLYCMMLIVTPVLLGLSLALSSYVIALPILQLGHSGVLISKSMPLIFSLLGFTLLYVIVPNAPVKFSEGLMGGLCATILFELAKHVFAFYISRYNSYTLLYGSLAVIPVFFIWVYWVWLITLLGAEVSYAFGKKRM
ncbi:MAG: YihY family inner membrane protein [Methylococcales bacterium]|nr:YihY family inner membrane protein [Methylococcales bacterium]